EEWIVEYKWDGIRGQFIRREGEVFIWSRGEELVTDQFPEIKEELEKWDGNFVIDGEILAHKDEKVLNINELPKRLNSKTLSKKMLEEIPISVFAYDLLEWEGEDFRELPFHQRREQLMLLLELNSCEKVYLSERIDFDVWEQLPEIRENAREINSE